MAEITGRDRIRACMKRTIADRIPMGIIVGPFTAKVGGYSLKDYLNDSRKLAGATIAAYELFRHDSVSLSKRQNLSGQSWNFSMIPFRR
jgi:hypothetical protein